MHDEGRPRQVDLGKNGAFEEIAHRIRRTKEIGGDGHCGIVEPQITEPSIDLALSLGKSMRSEALSREGRMPHREFVRALTTSHDLTARTVLTSPTSVTLADLDLFETGLTQPDTEGPLASLRRTEGELSRTLGQRGCSPSRLLVADELPRHGGRASRRRDLLKRTRHRELRCCGDFGQRIRLVSPLPSPTFL